VAILPGLLHDAWPAIAAHVERLPDAGGLMRARPERLMPKRIVYTRPDGGVSICAPSLTAMAYMTGGGGRWDGFPRGFLDRQIAKQAEEVGEWAAARFVRAMQFGGCSTAEAYGIMRDRFCAHLGTGCELWDTEDVPTDRWFRDAWRRSHNGGPIYVAMPPARRIQLRHITDAVTARNKARLALGRKPLAPQWGELGNAIRHARDETELRLVWPDRFPGAGAGNVREVSWPALKSARGLGKGPASRAAVVSEVG
jgi:hypothetical protein